MNRRARRDRREKTTCRALVPVCQALTLCSGDVFVTPYSPMLCVVRPDERPTRSGGCSRCIELAGGSPAAVSAGAPRSRPRAAGETPPSEWGVKSPQGAVWLRGGEQVRRPSIKRTLQPRDINNRKVGLAEPLMSRRRPQTAARTGARQDARGVRRRACGHSSMRNRRDPSRRPARGPGGEGTARVGVTTSGVGGPYKPTVKRDRVGRESEGSIVLLTSVEKAGRGKGPCFGHGGVRR